MKNELRITNYELRNTSSSPSLLRRGMGWLSDLRPVVYLFSVVLSERRIFSLFPLPVGEGQGEGSLRTTNYPLRTKRSSALIFTLLIIGLVASLTFFIGRSAVREVQIVNDDQNSLGAYYAAEAGLEDGLARIAAEHDIEVPTCAFGSPSTKFEHVPKNPGETVNDPCDSTDTKYNANLSVADLALANPLSYASRIRLAQFDPGSFGAQKTNNSKKNANNVNVDPTSTGAVSPGDYYYDLKITSRTQNFGSFDAATHAPADPTGNASAFIAKDTYKDFTLYTSGTDQPDELDYWWECQNPLPVVGCRDASKILQVTITRPNPTGGAEGSEDHIYYGTNSTGPGVPGILFIPGTFGAPSKVRVKALSDGAYVSIAFHKNAASYVYFKGTTARLQSIGYHAGIKRRLEADIDRTTGGLLGLFDYAVFAGSSFSQPQ